MKHASRRQSGHRSGPVIIAFDGSPAALRALQESAELWRRGPAGRRGLGSGLWPMRCAGQRGRRPGPYSGSEEGA
jgi:hypothetical protein